RRLIVLFFQERVGGKRFGPLAGEIKARRLKKFYGLLQPGRKRGLLAGPQFVADLGHFVSACLRVWESRAVAAHATSMPECVIQCCGGFGMFPKEAGALERFRILLCAARLFPPVWRRFGAIGSLRNCAVPS